jgi:hypothetical protein
MQVISRLFALLMVMTVAGTCSKNVMPAGDAASDVTTSDVTTSKDLGPTIGDVPPDTALTPPSGVTFPDAPQMSCGGDAGDCQFPPSVCADPSCDGGQCLGYGWVVYYDTPTCVSGQCAFTKRYFQCSFNYEMCVGGGCRFNGTIP